MSCVSCGTLLGAHDPIDADAGRADLDGASASDGVALDRGADGEGGSKGDSGPGPAGVRIVAGRGLQLAVPAAVYGEYLPAVTADGYLAYQDSVAGTANVVAVDSAGPGIPVATTSPVVVAAFAQANSLLIWPVSNLSSAFSALYGFTRGTGPTELSKTTPWPGAALSTDGSRVALWEVSDDGTYRLRVMRPDGGDALTLVASVPLENDGGFPIANFAGTRSDRILAAWCPSLPCSGIVLHSFDLTTPNVVDRTLATDAALFLEDSLKTDSTGDFAVVRRAVGQGFELDVFDLATGIATTIDQAVTNTGYFSGAGASEGITYLTAAAYTYSSIRQPSPVPLQSGSFAPGFVVPPSPDGSHVQLSHTWARTLVGFDLILAPAAGAGPPVPLAAGKTSAFVGNPWTADGTYALWANSIQTLSNGGFVGDLNATSVASASSTMVADRACVWWPLTGAKVAATVHSSLAPDGRVPGDLEVYDLSQSPTPRLHVAGADCTFLPTADGGKLVYSYTADPDPSSPLDGIWVVPVP
jgi:hypothetical protein